MLHSWRPIDLADALELLSKEFQNDGVRYHAVQRLNAVRDDEELLSILPQLVQAFKYETSYPSHLSEYVLCVERTQESKK